MRLRGLFEDVAAYYVKSLVVCVRCIAQSEGIESRWRRDFLHPSRKVLGLTQPPIQWVPKLSRE